MKYSSAKDFKDRQHNFAVAGLVQCFAKLFIITISAKRERLRGELTPLVDFSANFDKGNNFVYCPLHQAPSKKERIVPLSF